MGTQKDSLFIYFFALCSFINHSSAVASVRSGQNWDLKVNSYSASNNLKEATTYSFHRHVFREPIQYKPLTQHTRRTEVEKMQQETATLERLQHFRKRVKHFSFLPFSP